MADQKINTSRGAKFKILFMASLFFIPVVVAYVLFLSGWRPANTVNHGELVQPPRRLPDMTVQVLDGERAKLLALTDKWTLVYIGSAECLSQCKKNLYKMRQVHLAQAENYDRVQRLFIVTDATAMAMLRFELKEHPGMKVIQASKRNLSRLVRTFSEASLSPRTDTQRVFLVDPYGNYMLSYPEDADPTGMRKDLARLLRNSRTG